MRPSGSGVTGPAGRSAGQAPRFSPLPWPPPPPASRLGRGIPMFLRAPPTESLPPAGPPGQQCSVRAAALGGQGSFGTRRRAAGRGAGGSGTWTGAPHPTPDRGPSTYLRSWLTHHACRPQPGFHTGTVRLNACTQGWLRPTRVSPCSAHTCGLGQRTGGQRAPVPSRGHGGTVPPCHAPPRPAAAPGSSCGRRTRGRPQGHTLHLPAGAPHYPQCCSNFAKTPGAWGQRERWPGPCVWSV